MAQRKQQQKPAARGAKPKEKAPEPTKAEPLAAPDWVNETPDDTEYCLTMHDQEFQAQQQVSLTR